MFSIKLGADLYKEVNRTEPSPSIGLLCSNLCNDHNNKINVLPQLASTSILFKFSRTKGKRTVW